MKNLIKFIAAIAIYVTLSSCTQSANVFNSTFGGKKIIASNTYVTKNIKVDNFEKINLAGSMNVTYVQRQGSPQVEIYTSDNIVNLLDIRVENNALCINFKKNTSVSYKKLEIKVSSENLSGVSVAGSGNFNFSKGLQTTNNFDINIAGSGNVFGNNISCKDFTISVAGSGNINTESVKCANLETSIAGSGNLTLKGIAAVNAKSSVSGSGNASLDGHCKTASFNISGSGDLYGSELEAENVSASVSGSGEIKCFATSSLKARTSGSGRIGYKGNPKLDYPPKSLYRL